VAEFQEFTDLVGKPSGLAPNEDLFGFLWDDRSAQRPLRLSVADLTVEPLDDFAQRKECFDRLLVSDGGMKVLYPPTVVTERLDCGRWMTVPGTERPASLYLPPVSHKLVLSSRSEASSLRNTETFFVLQFLGFLYDRRVQFWDWQLDTRLLIQPRNCSFYVYGAEALLSKALARYRSLDRKRQSMLTNMLYLCQRSWHLYWEWERFLMEFMVLDSVRSFLANRTKPNWKDMIEGLGVPFDNNRIERMRNLRNDLFHQGLWNGAIPGFSVSDVPMTELRGLIERLVASLLGIGSSFSKSVWWDRQMNALQDD
jgi:hypothetical protein